MLLSKKILVFFLLFGCSTINVNAQVQIFSKNSLEKIKNGNTHIVVNDVNFPGANEFYAVFKKYWTLTKGIDFVKVSELKNTLKEGDSYFSIESTIIIGGRGEASSAFLYLSLWIPKERAVGIKRQLKVSDEIPIAHIQLSANRSVMENIFISVYNDNKQTYVISDFDGQGQIFHWNPGLLKNYLQQLSAHLETGKKTDFEDNFTDKDKLSVLKTKTLYCPDDGLNKMSVYTGKTTPLDLKEVFENYKFDYKIVTDQELKKIILDDKEPVYYLLFLRNSSNKMIAVINSRTGEIIYSRYEKVGSLKSDDLKELYKTINKN